MTKLNDLKIQLKKATSEIFKDYLLDLKDIGINHSVLNQKHKIKLIQSIDDLFNIYENENSKTKS